MAPTDPIIGFDYKNAAPKNWSITFCQGAYPPSTHQKLKEVTNKIKEEVIARSLAAPAFKNIPKSRTALKAARLKLAQDITAAYPNDLAVTGEAEWKDRIILGIVTYGASWVEEADVKPEAALHL
ncbi:MAG: hypothetical protein Q9196_006067 [Gyalolechia fulgens]